MGSTTFTDHEECIECVLTFIEGDINRKIVARIDKEVANLFRNIDEFLEHLELHYGLHDNVGRETVSFDS
jgi:hypothetical protein